MTTLQRYFMEIVAVCIPAIIVFLCFRPYRMKALAAMKLKSTRQREIALILFIISIFGILALTLWAAIYLGGFTWNVGTSSYID